MIRVLGDYRLHHDLIAGLPLLHMRGANGAIVTAPLSQHRQARFSRLITRTKCRASTTSNCSSFSVSLFGPNIFTRNCRSSSIKRLDFRTRPHQLAFKGCDARVGIGEAHGVSLIVSQTAN